MQLPDDFVSPDNLVSVPGYHPIPFGVLAARCIAYFDAIRVADSPPKARGTGFVVSEVHGILNAAPF